MIWSNSSFNFFAKIISEKLKIFNTSSALDLWFIIQQDLVKTISNLYLVSHEASHVDRLAGIIFGEGLWLSTVALGPLLGEEPLRPVAGSFEFPVRHWATNLVWNDIHNWMWGTILPPNFITIFTGSVFRTREYSQNTFSGTRLFIRSLEHNLDILGFVKDTKWERHVLRQ